MRQILTAERATLYHPGPLLGDYVRCEVRDLVVSCGKWAQFPSALRFEFTIKGKRKRSYLMQSDHPSAVVLEGWGHFAPRDAFQTVSQTAEMTVREGRYGGFDPRWYEDFNAELSTYLDDVNKTAKVLANYHGFDTKQDRGAAYYAGA